MFTELLVALLVFSLTVNVVLVLAFAAAVEKDMRLRKKLDIARKVVFKPAPNPPARAAPVLWPSKKSTKPQFGHEASKDRDEKFNAKFKEYSAKAKELRHAPKEEEEVVTEETPTSIELDDSSQKTRS